MPRKYSRSSQQKVARAMRKRKRGTLRSGRSGKKVTSRRQAVAIGLSEARRSGARVPSRGRKRRSSGRGSSGRSAPKRRGSSPRGGSSRRRSSRSRRSGSE